MLYNDIFPYDNGLIQNMNTVDSERIATLFTTSDISSLDLYISNKIGLREMAELYPTGDATDTTANKRLKIAKTVLDMFYNTWARIKTVLNESYNVFDVAVEDYNESSSNNSTTTSNTNNNIQNKSNAFDDTVTSSNTDCVANDTESTRGSTDTHSMTYHKVSTGALFTPMELLEKEINVREKYNFYDVICSDIKRILVLDVY